MAPTTMFGSKDGDKKDPLQFPREGLALIIISQCPVISIMKKLTSSSGDEDRKSYIVMGGNLSRDPNDYFSEPESAIKPPTPLKSNSDNLCHITLDSNYFIDTNDYFSEDEDKIFFSEEEIFYLLRMKTMPQPHIVTQ